MSETPCGCVVRVFPAEINRCPLHRNAARMRELLREIAEHSAWRATVNGGDTLHEKFYTRMTAILRETSQP